MSVVVATEREAVSDCFIDDIVRVMLHQEGDQGRYARNTEGVSLAIHATMRPHGGDGSEPVPQRPLLSDTKLESEGTTSGARPRQPCLMRGEVYAENGKK
jgi:hypothetical protein